MRKIIFIISILLSIFVKTEAHPFYVSICKVDYNNTTHSLEISLKVFADDFLFALEKKGTPELFLGEERENPKTDEYIFNYIQAELNFSVDGKKVGYSFVGKELEDDVVWVYMEVPQISSLNKIEVDCNFLTEAFIDQSNIIQVNKDETIKNLLLNSEKTQGEIVF